MIQSCADMLAEWGTQSYLEARGRTLTFSGKLEVPPLTADDCYFLQMAREVTMLQQALGTRGHAASLSFWCTAKLLN
jgi:hypothetical protein